MIPIGKLVGKWLLRGIKSQLGFQKASLQLAINSPGIDLGRKQ